jgi:cytochrome c6
MSNNNLTTSLLLMVCLAAFFSCGSESNSLSSRGAASARPAQIGKPAPDGLTVFRKYCVTCHGADGKLGLNGAKDLTQSVLPLEGRVTVITQGRKLMTPFGEVLSAEEINAVAAYTLTLKQQ